MSTRCQIEFRNGDVRRTVYRHWDGYPSAVIPDLLAFLAWSTRSGDAEYETANFLYWSKRELDDPQLGFGVCANDELHGDVEYYYVVEHGAGTSVRAYIVAHDENGPRIGKRVRSVAVPATFFNAAASARVMVKALPRVLLNGIWYFRDDRLREFRQCENPHERITFDEVLAA